MQKDTYRGETLRFIVGFDAKKVDQREQLADIVHHWRSAHAEPSKSLQREGALCGLGAFVLYALCFIDNHPINSQLVSFSGITEIMKGIVLLTGTIYTHRLGEVACRLWW